MFRNARGLTATFLVTTTCIALAAQGQVEELKPGERIAEEDRREAPKGPSPASLECEGGKPSDRCCPSGNGLFSSGDIATADNVTFATVNDGQGRTWDLAFDAAWPAEHAGRLPVIVFLHSGENSSDSRADHKGFVQTFAEGGYFACTIDYRTPADAGYDASLNDCFAALKFLSENASEYGVDMNRVGIYGHGCGGNLAAMVASTCNDHRSGFRGSVKSCVTVGAPTDLTMLQKTDSGSACTKWFGNSRNAHWKSMSPASWVDSGDASMLIIHGTNDTTVPFSQAAFLHEACVSAKVDSTFKPIAGAGHDIAPATLAGHLAEFFDATLGGNSNVVATGGATGNATMVNSRSDSEARRMVPHGPLSGGNENPRTATAAAGQNRR